MTDMTDAERAARESFSGKGLTETQFQEAWAISRILEAEIQRSGSFRDKLTDYAHAFSREEKFDALRGESILRDIFTARIGQSMNQLREGLSEREAQLPETARERALTCAETIGDLIRKPPTQPFYKVWDLAAVGLAREFGITQAGAKTLMKDAYFEAHRRDLYAAAKEIEAEHYHPERKPEAPQKAPERSRSPARARG
ncbi:MAG: hypothetical protein AAFU61_10115 [Pseudomonadota bacterium]